MNGKDKANEQMKQCFVKLERVHYSKIRMKCTGINLKCDIKQNGINSFLISVKRTVASETGKNYEKSLHSFAFHVFKEDFCSYIRY